MGAGRILQNEACRNKALRRKEITIMTIFGFPLYSFMHAYGIPAIILIFVIIDAIRGNYEGKRVEEIYGVDDWYRTF
jgi:hypothetical protein